MPSLWISCCFFQINSCLTQECFFILISSPNPPATLFTCRRCWRPQNTMWRWSETRSTMPRSKDDFDVKVCQGWGMSFWDVWYFWTFFWIISTNTDTLSLFKSTFSLQKVLQLWGETRWLQIFFLFGRWVWITKNLSHDHLKPEWVRSPCASGESSLSSLNHFP